MNDYASHITTIRNAELGILAHVHEVDEVKGKRVRVTFRDFEADETIEVRYFKHEEQATAYAEKLCR